MNLSPLPPQGPSCRSKFPTHSSLFIFLELCHPHHDADDTHHDAEHDHHHDAIMIMIMLNQTGQSWAPASCYTMLYILHNLAHFTHAYFLQA